ncbi:ferritin-like domain-containing protein [Hassallia byssoidea VB512170]|uniref:Ferritin-like domain-containing protein n=1 Tax=Hassallia byssoidea VB512170 TaxID=1304833 RepID=A0A846HEN9_9CYAN|nr:ferritin-like domain-containing protein [Hassalia byssoidea]NEU75815.1 ferritin-like domain-containing protein [Hassalia byssoidea VB512170]
MKTLLSLAGQLVVSLGLAATWGRMLILSLLVLSLLTIPVTPASAQSATLTPKEVVEYALTLEKLEADMYSRAFTAIESGGLMSLPEPAKKAIMSYGQDEGMHVTDLSAVLTSLGGDPDAIAIPKNPNYDAILNRDPFNNPQDFLLALQYVEDTGVAAYKGQVQNLLAAGDAGKVVLAGALEIHTIEARHAAGVRYLRQTYYGADVRPWIRDASEVLFNENREGSNSPIPFSNEAFDGFATKDEVIALVGPILTEK